MKIEIRSDTATIEGYVNAVGRDSREILSPRGSFVEQIVPGTFSRVLSRGKNIELRFNHGRRIGSTGDGRLDLYEDNIGLYAKAVIDDAEVVEKARRGELRGWSFGFRSPKESWEEHTPPRRMLEDMELSEVSILDKSKTPAYMGTSVEVREGGESLIEYRAAGGEEPEINIVYTPDYSFRRTILDLKRRR